MCVCPFPYPLQILPQESPIKTAKNLLLDGVNVNDFLPILEQRMEVVDTVFKETHDRQVFLDETNNKGNNRSKKADTPAVVINNSNNSGGFSSEGKYAHGAVGEGTKIDKGFILFRLPLSRFFSFLPFPFFLFLFQ